MIKIQDIQPADILPEGLRDDVSALGIAYAVCRQIEKWCVSHTSSSVCRSPGYFTV